mgnify:CR=1 FL=1
MKVLVGIPLPLAQEAPKKLLEDLGNLRGNFEVVFMRDLPEDAYKGDSIFRIAKARERIRAKVLAGDFTHLLFVDSDISFPPETLEVLSSQDADFVSHSYPSKLSSSLRVQRGLGCSLIKRKVLEKCDFLTGIKEDGNFDAGGTGEDILFRKKIEKEGFKILDLGNKLNIQHLPYDFESRLTQWMEFKKSKK